uniref:Uncharacterized protein n=1 Tax=Coccidioides posadasii RMSCC 3488 TaxID=454284 RepID=A0A0J6I3Y3_COCPO|nr:hypothetical protein CPAG_02427 [Coccidioides posadasii RMSCC 3488]
MRIVILSVFALDPVQGMGIIILLVFALDPVETISLLGWNGKRSGKHRRSEEQGNECLRKQHDCKPRDAGGFCDPVDANNRISIAKVVCIDRAAADTLNDPGRARCGVQ